MTSEGETTYCPGIIFYTVLCEPTYLLVFYRVWAKSEGSRSSAVDLAWPLEVKPFDAWKMFLSSDFRVYVLSLHEVGAKSEVWQFSRHFTHRVFNQCYPLNHCSYLNIVLTCESQTAYCPGFFFMSCLATLLTSASLSLSEIWGVGVFRAFAHGRQCYLNINLTSG